MIYKIEPRLGSVQINRCWDFRCNIKPIKYYKVYCNAQFRDENLMHINAICKNCTTNTLIRCTDVIKIVEISKDKAIQYEAMAEVMEI